MERHVDGFGALLFDTVIGNASCGAVAGLDWRRWLWMPEFFETSAQGEGFFATVEEGCKFRFGCAGEHFSQRLAADLDGAIGGRVWIGWKRWFGLINGPMASSAGARFRD